ncbi:hypothetical protein Ade02nite_00530 [Paractinoplanes deccanensis]|uniref:Integral membrane plasmid transfer protein n=1 Tax=Paractinoplanes deccanensis TaxID=113561 RepID=A0ABQ3XUI5_9ACTN|nr:hypothetical protein [Actinoplanes deccanensis]GID71412.1 hypothetical protein Ade02nite_00530 [Actinoplanes deccanensis]
MAQTPEEWLEVQADRALARQRAQADTAKLLATFAAGVAGALVATALQVGAPEGLDWASAWLLLMTFVGVLAVIAVDRVAEADHDKVLSLRVVRGWSQEDLLAELRVAELKAVYSNDEVVRAVRGALALQLLLALATGVVAAASLLT